MRDELLGYYERELDFLRRMGAQFAEKYPKIATRLLLEPDKCEDPHVERIIEAFAFLAGRIRLKIDDEFPEITESLLNVLYPHYLAPIPSMSIVQFSLDPEQAKLTTGYKIDRGTTLYSRPIQGTPCRFRTCYPVILWPLQVEAAAFESPDSVLGRGNPANAVLRIRLRCLNNTRLSDLRSAHEKQSVPIERLQFHLKGEPQLTFSLYQMIFGNAIRVELRPVDTTRLGARILSPLVLPPTSIKVVGFESDEAMLPTTGRSFAGYRLLTEYFAFPEKFLFFTVTGLDQAAELGFGDRFDILIYLRDVVRPGAEVNASLFQLGCTPIVNLFHKIAEPIELTHRQNEYHVYPDALRQMATEIYSIDSVMTAGPSSQQHQEYRPFYSIHHASAGDGDRTFWYSMRRQSLRKEDPATEVYLSLVNLKFDPHVPPVETITVYTTCTNRDLPGKLPFGGRENGFNVEESRQLSRVTCLKKPTNTLRPALRRGAHWRLISHLSLNHLSIVEANPQGIPDALQEILMLYDFMDSAATRKQITGISKVMSQRVVRSIGSPLGTGVVRGIETTLELDEEQYVGSGAFLFASVLERFLGLYASVNSFNQLVLKTKQREGILKRWPPRAGQQILL